MFVVKNLRSNGSKKMSSESLKMGIIKKTKSEYDSKVPRKEGTGKRPTIFKEIIEDMQGDIKILENVYIVTALKKYNADKNTRYLILIDKKVDVDERKILTEIINNDIPIYQIEYDQTETENENSYLSYWFRNNMGNGFSFVDIDYLLYFKKQNIVYLMEEKNTQKPLIGYGQLLSYKELLEDVISINCQLVFVYINNENINYINCTRNDLINPNKSSILKRTDDGFLFNEKKLQKADNIQEFLKVLINL